MRVVVIGAGPVGLHAGVAARGRGHEVVVFEAHDVAHHVRQWGHIRLFTPWSMVVTPYGLAAAGLALDVPDATPTGAELVSDYLEPLASVLDVRPHTSVVQVGRRTLGKADAPGSPSRVRDRFRVLVQTPDGLDVEVSDAVLDCTGVFADPAPAGAGGLLAPGEARARTLGLVRYGPLDVEDLAGRSVLVVGDGASGATVVDQLLGLEPAGRVHWLGRDPAGPGFEAEPDDLPERSRLHQRLIAARESIDVVGGVQVERMHDSVDGLRVTLTDGRRLLVDHLVACTGFRADHRLTRELHRTASWVTEGPAAIAEFLQGLPTDRLAETDLPPQSVAHPEPNFFVLGHKSFGRRPDFLLATGYRQIEAALDRLTEPSGHADGE